MSDKKKKKGFTLTEILVVVLIVSVLAAVIYPLYTKSITKSRAVEAINLLEMVRNKQLQKFARDQEYFDAFSEMGQLTSNKEVEVTSSGGAQLKVKDYTLSLNNATKCMSARYQKGATSFIFSTSYENTGLGCTGNICTSFGDIIGDAKSVCNCGNKVCSGGKQLNEETCNCDCYMSCDQGGKCYDEYGGGLTRACSSGCGTETSISTCGGSAWSGKCWSPTQTQPTSQKCGKNNTGTQTRICTANCNGGTCGAWGVCTGQSCPDSEKPDASEACGKCGTKTRSVTCDSSSGVWSAGTYGACTGEGVCTPGETAACGNDGTKTCTSSCGWSACSGEKVECAGDSTQSCGNCGTQTRTCDRNTGTWSAWGECSSQGECKAGGTQSCGDGNGTQTCSDTCGWNTCVCKQGYSWKNGTCEKDAISCNESEKPATTRTCGYKCGTETGTVECDTATGKWGSVVWSGSCGNEGICVPRTEKKACSGGNGFHYCNDKCEFADCLCDEGYKWDGSACVSDSCPMYCPSGQKRTSAKTPADGECCVNYNIEYKLIETKVASDCSANRQPSYMCTGGVVTAPALRNYTAHEKVACENRAKGSWNWKTTGDGSKCGDANMYWLFGNADDQEEVTSCYGQSSFPSKCTGVLSEKQCSYEGQVLCMSTDYYSGCLQINTKPCIQNGDYCENLERERFVRAVYRKSYIGVYVCK